MKKIFLYTLLAILFLASILGCTTPYAYQNNGFEDVVVIEATLTNEYKTQEVKISRTYSLEENFPQFESQAVVYITDNLGNKYEFDQNTASYTSITPFQALPDREYQLHILTKNGRTYESSIEKLTTPNQISSVVPTAVTKNGILGVEITVNSSDPTNTSKYYRYEYDETYKVVAPMWHPNEAIPAGNVVTLRKRTTEARTCYSNQKSEEILLTNTNNISEDIVSNFPIKFISSKDPIIKNRYSILVKQYVQSLTAHTYYETLKEISNNGNVLSQTQPGFLYGNIKSIDSPGEKVIGFFDVSSYSEKRLFFNFTDLFQGVLPPSYPYYCPAPIPDSDIAEYYFNNCYSTNPNSTCQGPTIVQLIESRIKVYYPTEGPLYILYPIECGDCTSFSSNIKPSFWID
ncbi:DUF4249 domain-containing protein [Flavobacterium geliluteum]|uniref:DUF4249 domain-containing protein n=1 Tax=Flavobacterium geliluteum TaxID=2816120 RepID=A0A940X9D8_9FLAO|nr:DUF4249 domain-containing protein [Flavobacterium geliluteum]MBP4139110.1 DUF4249 domain-containing protein [Flavobacterium geliluteum]